MMKEFFNKVIKYEQAANDLSAGLPISLKFQGKQHILVGLSCITSNDFDLLKNLYKPVILVVSKYRAQYLGINTNENLIKKIEGLDYSEIIDISGISHVKPEVSNYSLDGNFFDKLIMLATQIEIVPSFILFETNEVDQFRCFEDLMKITKDLEPDMSFREISRAKLKIRSTNEKIELVSFKSNFAAKEHYSIIIGDLTKTDVPLVRLHSSCYTGDLLGSITCDCYDQLHLAIDRMVSEGGGIILYLMQEGRGIGLSNKLHCYHLQNNGLDTVDANLAMGFPDDARILWPASQMLKSFNIQKVKLLTNNPHKTQELEKYGIEVIENVRHIAHTHKETEFYMETKAKKMGHKI